MAHIPVYTASPYTHWVLRNMVPRCSIISPPTLNVWLPCRPDPCRNSPDPCRDIPDPCRDNPEELLFHSGLFCESTAAGMPGIFTVKAPSKV
jgi:hypothetical protein